MTIEHRRTDAGSMDIKRRPPPAAPRPSEWRYAQFLFVAVLAACGAGKEDDDTGGSAAPTTVPAPCTTAPASFTSTVWPSLQTNCAGCHVAGGVASGTRLVFAPSAGTIANYNTLRDFSKDNSALLLSKSIGQPAHAGGAPYVNTSSAAYMALNALVPEMAAQVCTTTVTPPTQAGGYWGDVAFAADTKVLAKATVLFAGRNPTADETAAAGASQTALRQTIRSLMQGPAFERWLDDVGDTHFLTPGVPVRGNGGLNVADWATTAGAMLGANGVTQVDAATRNRFDAAVRREGVELMKFVVRNERPFTEMVTANYTVANGILAQYLGATVQGAFTNAADDTEWRQATLPDQRLTGNREHAGVLSTHAWLSRFPTTDTNRNRHRVNMLFKQFLATDVTAMAVRPQDDGQSFRVPTVENPACAACHDTIDPIAAGFQNWNEANRFLPNRTNNVDHALPGTYRSNNYPKDANNMAYYRAGDNWFRDSKEPGYAGTVMPGGFTGNRTALQFLGGQVAADQRFALGAVHFWYEGLFGREPLRQPTDSTLPQYAALSAAYNAQNEELQAVAARFKTDQGRGAYNVKDLLVDLMMTKWGRAERVASSNATRDVELKDIGSLTMLSPSQLQRKLVGLVGEGWTEFNNPYAGWALNYGDFDGVGRTNRAQSHTMMQTVTVDRFVASRSCNIAKLDFDKPAASRMLFTQATMADTPATTAGLAAITANVRHLHKWLWKDDVPETDAEVQRTVKLFTDTWADRATAPARPVNCVYNNGNDANYTGRAWAAVLAYMLGDVKFLYE